MTIREQEERILMFAEANMRIEGFEIEHELREACRTMIAEEIPVDQMVQRIMSAVSQNRR